MESYEWKDGRKVRVTFVPLRMYSSPLLTAVLLREEASLPLSACMGECMRE